MRPLIQSNLEDRLERYPAWPVKAFKLEMEGYEIYQDETGIAIDELDHINKLEVDGNTYYVENGTSKDSIRGTNVYDMTERFREFLYESGEIANLACYVALCKIYTELEGNINEIEVHPESNFGVLYHTNRIPDALIKFPGEYIPIEVYNGADYFNERNDKYNQLRDLCTEAEDAINSNPIFVNRRSEGEFKKTVREDYNLLVVDIDRIFSFEDIYSEYEDSIQFLHTSQLIYTLPKLTGANGDLLTGLDYDLVESGDQGYSEQERIEALRPPEDMLGDLNELPRDFVKRVRGGVQLQYVNTLYRRADDGDSIRRAACLVMQELYNNILRSELAVDKQDAINDGWDDAKDQYEWLVQLDRDSVLREVESIIDELKREKIITTPESDKVSPRQSIHPQPSFYF